MNNLQITLFFAETLLGLLEDPKAFPKYCAREYMRAWAVANPDKIKASNAKNYQLHKPARDAANRLYAVEHKQEVSANKKNYYANNREAAIKRASDWATENRERANANKLASHNRRKQRSKAYRWQTAARSRIWWAVNSQQATKAVGGLELLGVQSREEFFEKLQEKFAGNFPPGDYGTDWEWDHIRPCASFDLTDPAQQKACFHWTNFQPLPVKENRSKGAKWNPEKK